MNGKLKPCPFCGSEDVEAIGFAIDFSTRPHIRCNDCGVDVYDAPNISPIRHRNDSMMQAWNTRANDKRQLRTLKWLEQVANKKFLELDAYNPYKGNIYARFGRFYATNGYSVACVEFPEYANAGEDVWETVTFDSDGLKFGGVSRDMRDNVFERLFTKPHEFGLPEKVLANPALFAQALKGFEINRLVPTVQFAGYRVMLAAHNKDVSIKVVCMLTK